MEKHLKIDFMKKAVLLKDFQMKLLIHHFYLSRIINKICNSALMIAASKSLDCIDAEIIISAVNDMELA